jgi:hypothetical protein
VCALHLQMIGRNVKAASASTSPLLAVTCKRISAARHKKVVYGRMYGISLPKVPYIYLIYVCMYGFGQPH